MSNLFQSRSDSVNIAPIPSLTMLSTWDCKKYEHRDYLLKGIITPSSIGCVYGAPGSGKSTITPFIAYNLSLGKTVFGIKSKISGVMYVAAEDSSGMMGRVDALSRHYGQSDLFKLVPYSGNLYDDQDFDSLSLSEAARNIGASLIVIDTLAAAFPGLEENDAASMGRVVHCAEKIAAYTGAAVVLVHHDTKTDGGTPRGHGILNGRFDWTLHVRKARGGLAEAKLVKNRNGPSDRQFHFKISSMELGIDSEGDPITAPICEEVVGSYGHTKARPSNNTEIAAMQILDELQLSGPVQEREWLSACAAGNRVSGATELASRTRAARRIVQNLKDRGVIESTGSVVARTSLGH